ncbi:MAG: hypothetical protein A3J74_07790 [Elusimicrobia bacterium RIFCSPHIGHO2_02_FULL_57_9]|nr:MAG: hypothetical protein A3J74_07790 [Elusimicrobia bacterium RIFCSPHIGHO2_02_FULL_57_9]
MTSQELALIDQLLENKDYAGLEQLMTDAGLVELAQAWPRFKPLDKLILFKLLDAARAMEFYGLLPFKEKYYLLCGFPLNSIAPVLENLDAAGRRRFVQLPREFYDRMFRQLVSDRLEMTVSVGPN